MGKRQLLDASNKRILIKLSGEALAGDKGSGFDTAAILDIVEEIVDVREMGFQPCIVIGGGNLFRGNMRPPQVERATGDSMGMLSTIMNALALRDFFESGGTSAEVYSNLPIPGVVRPFVRREARQDMDRGTVVIFAGGLGKPYFTTDTTAAWAALEMQCGLVVKATNVDGVYSGHPAKDPDARLYDTLTYAEVLEKELRVMDLTAMTLLKDYAMPLVVLNVRKKGNLKRMVAGGDVGTLVTV
ncbi:MAG: UMP kinase [Deltaproteobacteria bacterium]|nr:UMP kinase [Deltaproteobacteria bacterium]